MKKKKRCFRPFQFLMYGLIIFILYFGGSLIRAELEGQKEYQEILDLGEIPYDEKFLEEIQKMDGFLSVSPVYEIPVKLKWEDYTLDTVFTAVDMDEFQMTGNAPEEISLGNTPALFIGEDALGGLTDSYGHTISGKGLEKLQMSADCLVFCLSDEENILWRPCILAGNLIHPSQGIYISLVQASALMSELPPVKKILLTTQGEMLMCGKVTQNKR